MVKGGNECYWVTENVHPREMVLSIEGKLLLEAQLARAAVLRSSTQTQRPTQGPAAKISPNPLFWAKQDKARLNCAHSRLNPQGSSALFRSAHSPKPNS